MMIRTIFRSLPWEINNMCWMLILWLLPTFVTSIERDCVTRDTVSRARVTGGHERLPVGCVTKGCEFWVRFGHVHHIVETSSKLSSVLIFCIKIKRLFGTLSDIAQHPTIRTKACHHFFVNNRLSALKLLFSVFTLWCSCKLMKNKTFCGLHSCFVLKIYDFQMDSVGLTLCKCMIVRNKMYKV